MKLTVFNGSPRGKGSNTKILLDHFLAGFATTGGNSYELAYLVPTQERENLVGLFGAAERVILAFPLYTDAMPAPVKTFIESLEPLCGQQGNPDLGFIVQSGFPESTHSGYVEHYLKTLAERLGCRYTGTVVKGGVEGIQSFPTWMNRNLFKSFFKLGTVFGATGQFDEKILRQLAKPEKLSKFQFKIFKFAGETFFWNKLLKKNGAFEKCFDRPYGK
jgi:multimeric flavodoxin WrbA